MMLKRTYKKKYDEQDKLLTEYIARNLELEKKLSEMESDYQIQRQMAEEIKRIQEQVRLLKHDMKNHTMVILSYLEEKRIEEAKIYAGEILNKLNRMYTYVNVGNALLSYIMNHKLSEAKEKELEIKAEIENLPFTYMDSVDFSALLNNILDNAIRGAAASKERKIEVQIYQQNGMDIVTVKNSIDESVLDKNPTLVSTKKEAGHGYGMKQIKGIVEKYDGMMDVYEKKQMFVVSVMLNDMM